MHRLILPLTSLALVGLGACARLQSAPQAQPSVTQQGEPRAVRGLVTDHVIVISVDGLRPDAIDKYNAATLQRLMREGRYSLTAQTIAVSSTLPSHTSMLTGVDVDTHGVTWNSDKTKEHGHVSVPTIFGLAHTAGFQTAAFFSKTKFNQLEVPETLDHVRGPKGGLFPWASARTADLVAEYLETARPNLMFVHLADADFAGHTFGWMGHMYGMAVREADIAVAKILQDADAHLGRGRYTVIVTSDHGGHGKRHGSDDPRDTTIPWIVWGAGVQGGEPLSDVRTMDTAATVMWMLGVTTPEGWVGRVVSPAFLPTVANVR